MCEFRQFETVEGGTWTATSAGVTKTIDQPISNYRLIGFLCISLGYDNRSHRQVQWYPTAWLQKITNNSDAKNKTILFNYSRSNSDRRAWVEFVQNNSNRFTFLKTADDDDKYDLVVLGLK